MTDATPTPTPAATPTSRTELAAKRAAIQAELASLNQQEAANDLAYMQQAMTALNDPSIATLVTALTALKSNIANPNRAAQIGNVVQVINTVKGTLTTFIAEAQKLATPPAPPAADTTTPAA